MLDLSLPSRTAAAPVFDLSLLSQEQRLELAGLIDELERRRKTRLIESMFPDTGPLRRELYPRHLEFFLSGAVNDERVFMAGNRVGKTVAAGTELTYHLTGRYPHWWRGRRFKRAIRALASGDTHDTTRDIIQDKLLGGTTDETLYGTGLIPGDDIVGWTKRMGVPGAVEKITVRHVSGENSDLSAKAHNVFSKVALAWGKPFAAAEQFNRRVTFIAAFRTAVAEGIENPARFAEEAIRDTQFVYNKGNKPQWARGAIGGTLFTFKQYSISYMELLHRMATTGGAEGKKAALFSLGMLFLMGGAGGLPFMGDAEDVLDGIMQRLGYSFSTKQARRQFFIDLLGADGAAFVERGVSGLPGVPIDVAGRLGMGNVIPGTGLLTKKEDYGRDMAELLGPAGDLAQRAFQGVGQALSGKPFEGLTTAAPTAVRNVAKAFDMYQTGMYRDQKGRKVIDVDGYDALVKAIGFQPRAVAQVQEANATQQDLIAQNKLMKRELADSMAAAVFERDLEKQQDVRNRMLDWNRTNPHSPVTIDMAGVRRRVIAMRQSKAERVEKSAPKAIRGDVRAALQEGSA